MTILSRLFKNIKNWWCKATFKTKCITVCIIFILYIIDSISNAIDANNKKEIASIPTVVENNVIEMTKIPPVIETTESPKEEVSVQSTSTPTLEEEPQKEEETVKSYIPHNVDTNTYIVNLKNGKIHIKGGCSATNPDAKNFLEKPQQCASREEAEKLSSSISGGPADYCGFCEKH